MVQGEVEEPLQAPGLDSGPGVSVEESPWGWSGMAAGWSRAGGWSVSGNNLRLLRSQKPDPPAPMGTGDRWPLLLIPIDLLHESLAFSLELYIEST
jgi:hypothetical protein